MTLNSALSVFRRYFAISLRTAYVSKQPTKLQDTMNDDEILENKEILEKEDLFRPKSMRYAVCQVRAPVHKLIQKRSTDEKFDQSMKELQPCEMEAYKCGSK